MALFGETDESDFTAAQPSDNEWYGTLFTLATDGVIENLRFWGREYSGYHGYVKMAIFADNSGTPSTLIAVTESKYVDSATNQWWTLWFDTPVPLEAGDYWIAFICDPDFTVHPYCGYKTYAGRRMLQFFAGSYASPDDYDSTNYNSNGYEYILHAVVQVTKTVKPTGGDYSTLEGCLNDNEDDLVSLGACLFAEIDGDWMSSPDTTIVNAHNYTTDENCYVNIYTKAGDARHNGVLDGKETAYSLESGVYSGNAFSSTVDFIYIDGLQIKGANDTYDVLNISATTSYSQVGATISNCLLFKNGTSGNCIIVTGGQGAFIYNNICMQAGTGIILSYFWDTYIYSNTVVLANGSGIEVSNNPYSLTPLIYNNLCNGNGQDYDGTWDGSSASNISEDTSSPNSAYREKVATFVDNENFDFHLSPSDTVAIDEGVDLSGDFTTDIDGVARPGTWDIGADEYVSTVTLDQEGFLFRADDGDEDGASPLASQDVDITRGKELNTRLRVLVDASGDPVSKDFQLEYKKQGNNDWTKI